MPGQRRRPWDESNAGSGKTTKRAKREEEKQSLDESTRKALVMVQARGLLSVQQMIYLLAPVSKAMRGWLLFDYSWTGPMKLRPHRAITDGGLAHLAGLTALQTLELVGCRAITDGGLVHLAGLTALQA